MCTATRRTTKVRRNVTEGRDGQDDRIARHGVRPVPASCAGELRVWRVLGAQAGGGRRARRPRRCRRRACGARCDQRRDLAHLGLAHPRGGDRGGAEAQPAGDERLLGVVRDRVLVDGDAGTVERLLGLPCRSPRTGRRSTSIRWLSVPPDTIRKPSPASAVGQRRRVAHDLRRRSRGTPGSAASWNATALAAITCMSGPPCSPGKTALSIAAACSLAAQDAAGARAAQGLVGGERDDVGVRAPATGARRRR